MSNRETSVKTTPYKDDELEHFRELLEKEQEETRQQIEDIKASLDDLKSNQGDENSAAAHHQGDIASEEDEREKLLIMLEKEDHKLDEINEALNRIELGTYGVCEDTGQKIKEGRLEAIPYTRYSIEAQKKEEG